MKTINKAKAGNKTISALITIGFLMLIIYWCIEPTCAVAGDSTLSVISKVPASENTDIQQIEDPYGVYPRYDPSSSVRKSNPAPEGYSSVLADSVSGFGIWLRNYPMRGAKEPLTTNFGTFLADATVIGGVLDVPTTSPGGNARGILYPLMHEYAKVTHREMELNYQGMGLDSVSLFQYMTGNYSTNSNRTKYFWKEGEEKTLDEDLMKRFTEFLRTITSYKSLIRDCQEIEESEVLPGDLFIQADTTSREDQHLAVVLDVATLSANSEHSAVPPILRDKNKVPYERIFLFGNSLTPATSFHIIKPIRPGKGNWIVPGELAKKLKHMGPGKFYRLTYSFLR